MTTPKRRKFWPVAGRPSATGEHSKVNHAHRLRPPTAELFCTGITGGRRLQTPYGSLPESSR
jgi:hypothetical protein